MSAHVLQEADWQGFVDREVLPLCVPGAGARVFALVGDLGAGKTTFSKTLLKSLGVGMHVQSPTFSIINSYDISYRGFAKVFHVDVYRIEDTKELEVLHFADTLADPKNVVVIEWADTVRQMIPQDATWITFEHDTAETRKVIIEDAKN
jgi:tRNA threonylcarbamoyladenosine biosynthesis protein TsaE